MKNLIILSALAFALVVFKTEGDAADFRAATLIGPTHIGRVVRLNAPLKVVP